MVIKWHTYLHLYGLFVEVYWRHDWCGSCCHVVSCCSGHCSECDGTGCTAHVTQVVRHLQLTVNNDRNERRKKISLDLNIVIKYAKDTNYKLTKMYAFNDIFFSKEVDWAGYICLSSITILISISNLLLFLHHFPSNISGKRLLRF